MSADPRQDLGTFEVVAGDPLSLTVNVVSTTGAAVDLTAFGTDWACDLRQATTDTDPVVSFTVDDAAADAGTLVLSLTGVQSDTLTLDAGDTTLLQGDIVCSGGTVTPQTPFHLQVAALRKWTG